MHSSIGQNIKSSAVSDVRCLMSDVDTLLRVRARALTVAIFNRFWWNLAQTSGTKVRHDPWKKFAKRGRGQGYVTLNFFKMPTAPKWLKLW